jgi:hypothetical protein
MKNLLFALCSLSLLCLSACSRKEETSVKPPSTPDTARLKSDSERLQQATANAAKAREKESQAIVTPTPSPTP